MDFEEQRKSLVKKLESEGILKSEPVIKAFLEVPREEFIPEKYRKQAYEDHPIPIGEGQTISAPHMVAIMTELLKPEPDDRVLEVGAGSGYQAAILSRLVKEIYTVELESSLVVNARKALKKTGCGNVTVITGVGSRGYSLKAPFDKIIVACAAEKIPDALKRQLKEEGRIVAPLGGTWHQELTLGIKRKGSLDLSFHGGCVFVPLRH